MKPYRPAQDRGGTPPFVKPFLSALNQIHQLENADPDIYIDRAEKSLTLLRGEDHTQIITATSRGSIGLQADHTHYFDGFALMLPVRRGVAVSIAISSRAESRLLIEGSPAVETFSLLDQKITSDSEIVRLLKEVTARFAGHSLSSLDVCVVSGLPAGLRPVSAASFAVAYHRALEKLIGAVVGDRERIIQCTSALEDFLGHRFSPAYVIGSNIQELNSFVLVDTKSLEFVPLDVAEGERPGWGIVDPAPGEMIELPSGRFELIEMIVEKLKSKRFPGIDSIRDIEHKDIEAAEKVLPRKLKPLFQFLVTENRRVQQLVSAVRRKDWQLSGAILNISHEARNLCWGLTSAREDEVIDLAERFGNKGVYGATQTGEGTCLLVIGQRFAIPGFLEAARNVNYTTKEKRPETLLL